MAGQLWVRMIRRNRIKAEALVPCGQDAWQEALQEACRELDLSVPLIVQKHLRDWEQYAQTRFLPEHFLDGLQADRLEVEYFDLQSPGGRRSQDPRNG